MTSLVARTGRPRSAEADEAILDAAVELFGEVGFEGFTVEAVAARAGVGKATIYRRYPSRVDLVMAATTRLVADVPPDPNTGTFESDLRAWAYHLVHLVTETPAGKCMAPMVFAATRNPELAAAHRQFVRARRQGIAAMVRRGIERGELEEGTDPATLGDLVAGSIFYRHLVSGARLDRAYADEIVARVLRAFGR